MFLPTKRTDGVSTSDLIVRVLRGYDEYIWRNLQKKYTPEELGISQEYALYVKLKRSYKNLANKRLVAAQGGKPEPPKSAKVPFWI